MDKLTNEQSLLLRRLESGAVYYSDLTDAELRIYKFLNDLGYAKSKGHSHNAYDGQTYKITTAIDYIYITELGRMYLINEDLSASQMQFIETQMEALRSIASSASEQAETAKADSAAAKHNALWSRILSIIAIVISIGAIIVPILV